MTAYHLRVKLDRDPTSLWRDIAVGEDRTLEEFRAILNDAVGLDDGHLWFFGADDDYWKSNVKFYHPEEYDELASGEPLRFGEEIYDAGSETIGEMAARLDLEEGDRICYLYDYGDEWRFYAILKEIKDGEPSDSAPEILEEKGEPVVQYPGAGEERRYR